MTLQWTSHFLSLSEILRLLKKLASAMSPTDEAKAAVEFGRFQLLPHRRLLLADGVRVELGNRAFDTLVTLVDRPGELVTKDELLNCIWPGVVVEENNLQAQVSALRRALGSDRELIRTIAGRGYQFTGEIRTVSATRGVQAIAGVAQRTPTSSPAPTNLPEPVSELIGRDIELDEVLSLSATHRLVTLIGAGGIGKTRLGFEVARHLLSTFADGVWLADLAALSDPGLVVVTVATALGLEPAAMSADRVRAVLGPKRLLLVLDNCEHVIEAAARISETLLRAAPSLHVLATSSEPLAVEGEHIYRVPPLGVPPPGAQRGEQVWRHGAVRLFLARAQAVDPRLPLDDRAAAAIGTIVRRLDGIPLAVELAAARAATLGLQELADRLDDRFALLTHGHRTALPRHQTLRAALDWSHGLLVDAERTVLRRLAVFAGGFAMEAATEVVANDGIAAADVAVCVADLVAKSLVVADTYGVVMRYRLLATTRTYAFEELAHSGELPAVTRRHADHYRKLFERAATLWAMSPTTEWLAVYSPDIDNVRVALDRAIAPGGDASAGAALAAAAAPLWIQMSQLDECRARVEQALGALDIQSEGGRRQRMLLQAALGVSLGHTNSPVSETAAVWTRVLELAESLGDPEYKSRALYGLWLTSVHTGGYPAALAFAKKFRSLAESTGDAAGAVTGDRIVGVALHFLGDQSDARAHIERTLDRYVPSLHGSHAVRFGLDQRVNALTHLSRLLWVQGFPDQASRTAQAAVTEAEIVDHANSLCLALADGAVPIAILTGELPAAEQYVAVLIDLAEKHGLKLWHICGVGLRGWISVQMGDAAAGAMLLQLAADGIEEGLVGVRYTMYLGWLAEALGDTGHIAEAISAVNAALQQCDRNEERWCFPELLRIRGELALRENGTSPAIAESDLLQALDWAHRQRTLSWELRAAASLARLWRNQGRITEAYELLAPAYGRFNEGFGTPDLKAAKALVDDLHAALKLESAGNQNEA